MAIKIKAGTTFVLPVEIDDSNFEQIAAIEFLFKQTDDRDAETLKTAYWSKEGESRDAERIDGEKTVLVRFSAEDSYLFQQGEMFFLDTRIHYTDAETNPYTPIVGMRMEPTLFAEGEGVSP